MADLNVNISDIASYHEDMGSNLIKNNANFENAPSFTAATSTSGRWIDGTAGGSTTNDIYGWGTRNIIGTSAAQFDSSTSNSGSNSMKVSTLATGARIDVQGQILATAVSANQYGIPVRASTPYIMTFWMKTNLTSGSSTTGAKGVLVEINSSGASVATTGSTAILTTTNWTKYTINKTTTSTTAYLDFNLRVYGNDGTATLIMDAWFDDIYLQSVTPNGNIIADMNPVVTAGIQDISGPKIWS